MVWFARINRIQKITKNLNQAKVLVIGDLILDEFVWGKVSRISPEAPVPVVWVNSESFMPGGAANVASNIRALGGEVFLSGIIGQDARGEALIRGLKDKGIDSAGVISDASRPTTLKTRVIAHNQQVVRIDKENSQPIGDNLRAQIITYLQGNISSIDAILVEDYGKGVITPGLIQEVVRIAREHRKIITVDPKEDHFSYYQGVNLITPNHREASRTAGMEIKDEATLQRAGKKILQELNCQAVLITLGEDGMCLFENSGATIRIPTVAREVYDVSGAGDTVIAACTASLCAGANMRDAAHISNFAAGIVVGKVGIAVVTQEELLKSIKKR